MVCTLWLGGCALPVPVQIASWAIDGLLYITTEKTKIDHGISLIAQKDCAVLRVVATGSFCHDDDAPVVLAFASNSAPLRPIENEILEPAEDAVLRLAAFKTAAEPTEQPAEPVNASVENTAVTSADEATPVEWGELFSPTASGARWQAIIALALDIERLMEFSSPGSAMDLTSVEAPLLMYETGNLNPGSLWPDGQKGAVPPPDLGGIAANIVRIIAGSTWINGKLDPTHDPPLNPTAALGPTEPPTGETRDRARRRRFREILYRRSRVKQNAGLLYQRPARQGMRETRENL
ncbi:MAG: hypothetical protein FJX42_05765 [Alphaproteobacteria bacterium]|nr:hypothetical protein [Alphaproteobacteria bacterium]